MYDRILLFPYTLFLTLRHKMYDKGFLKKSVPAEVPTVCVGNITVGGTGKTPHTELLLDILRTSGPWGGKNVAVLSRGYKRSSKGFQQVVPDGTADFYGDEPLQIKKKYTETTVAVDKDRLRGCDILCHPEKLETLKAGRKCINKQFPAADLIILDDAYQYRKLRATLNLVLIDYSRPTFNDKLLPLGHLRDLPSRMQRADAIVISKCPTYMDDWEKQNWARSLDIKDYNMDTCEGLTKKGKPVRLFFTCLSYCEPVQVFDSCDPRYAYAKRTILFTGIAKDTPLRQYLSDTYKIVDHYSFPDHHRFTSADIRMLAAAIKKWPTAAMVTTEKDAQRMLDCKEVPQCIKEKLFQVPIKVGFQSESDQRAFTDFILGTLDERAHM